MDNIERWKQNLFLLARSHMNTEAGTPEEIHLYGALDRVVNELLASRVSEAEIRRIISNGQAYGDGRRPPPFATRRYMTPAQSEEIRIMTTAALYNPIEDDDNYDDYDDYDDYDEGAVPIPGDAVVAVPRPRPGAAAVVAAPAAVPRPAAAAAVPKLDGEDEDIDSKDLDEYKILLRCPSCLGNIKDVRLSPCGHMMCKTCLKDHLARGENKCPVCRQRFTSYDKVYYSKYLKYKNKYYLLKKKLLQ